MNYSYVILIIALVIAIFLIVCENIAHDCAPGKNPTHKLIPPDENDDIIQRIRKIRQMIHDNSKFIIWRQAIIVSMILPFPVTYFLNKRLPNIFEFIIIAMMTFIGVYFSYMWMWSRYVYPNTAKMEKTMFQFEKDIIEDIGYYNGIEEVKENKIKFNIKAKECLKKILNKNNKKTFNNASI